MSYSNPSDGWELWNRQQNTPDEPTEPEDALELIRWEAAQGRVKTAWRTCREQIQHHFSNRPANSARHPTCEEEWLGELQQLLAIRRRVHPIAAESLWRMCPADREVTAMFNRWLGED